MAPAYAAAENSNVDMGAAAARSCMLDNVAQNEQLTQVRDGCRS
jgi:hypothetical protein